MPESSPIPRQSSARRSVSPILGLLVGILVAAIVWRAFSRPAVERPNSETALVNDSDRYARQLQRAVRAADSSPEQALQALDQIPPEADEYLPAMRHAARIALLSGDDERAERSLRILEQSDPDDFAVQLSLAELLHRQKRSDAALSHAERALTARPDRVDSHLLLAEILDDLRRVDEMVPPLQKAVALDPSRYDAHANLAYALHFAGQLEEAEAEARWCLERRPELAAVRGLLARIERDRGNLDTALGEVRHALQIAPDDPELRILEADLLVYLGDYETAYQRLIPLRTEHYHSRPYLAVLSRAALLSGRGAEAREYQAEMLSLTQDR